MFDRIVRRLERVRLTRESLVRMALAIFGGFVLLSLVMRIVGLGPSVEATAMRLATKKGLARGEQLLVDHLRAHPEDRDAWIALCRVRGTFAVPFFTAEDWEREVGGAWDELLPGLPPPEPRDVDHRPALSETDFEAFIANAPVPVEILRAWRDHRMPPIALEHLRESPDDLEFRLAGGDIARFGERFDLAEQWYRKALDLDPQSTRAARGWTTALFKSKKHDAFLAALDDPVVREAVSRNQLARVYEERGEYGKMFLPLIIGQYERWTPAVWVTVVVIGLCWLLLVFHLSHGWTWLGENQLLIVVALALGWISAELTLYTVIFADELLGDGVGRQVGWYIADAFSIGLREEFCKLLCFVPMLPLLVRRASESQGLAFASLVGLGFAINENGNYYIGTQGASVLGRYFTANFAHMALTGYAGYYLFRAARIRRKPEWIDALEAFAKVVVAHAAYDFFLIAPQVDGYQIVSMIVFIIVAQQYLRLMFRIRDHRMQRVSATRVFIACLATVSGMHYLYISGYAGVGAGVWHTFGGFLAIALLCFMYFNEFDEHVA